MYICNVKIVKRIKRNLSKIIVAVVLISSVVMFTTVGVLEVRDAIAAHSQTAEAKAQWQDDNGRVAHRMRRVALGMLGVFVFTYMMGRRKLMKQVWRQKRDLVIARNRAEESDRMKSVFIRLMSHEIRTPLNAVKGFSQVLCDEDFELTDEQREDIRNRIRDNVRQLTSVVEELLEMSLMESNQVAADMEMVGCNDICREVMMTADHRQKKNVTVLFQTDVDDRVEIRTHRRSLSHILKHLLNNAEKFTDNGSVTLSASVDNGRLLLSVTDTGVGIAPINKERVFEKFAKLDAFTEGIGLGLPICRHLARFIHGKLWLDTEYQEGCRFVLALPLK